MVSAPSHSPCDLLVEHRLEEDQKLDNRLENFINTQLFSFPDETKKANGRTDRGNTKYGPFRTVSSSGYRETAGNKTGLLSRTGCLKDVNDVRQMYGLIKK